LAVGQINVNTATEANEANALARLDLFSLADEFDDSASEQAGDLHEANATSAFHLDREGLTFVVGAGFVEFGIDERDCDSHEHRTHS
jgi:hypothetical protein